MMPKADFKIINTKTESTTTTTSTMTKRRTIPAATSPMAMGKALVLLATSCAALSGGPSPMTAIGVRGGGGAGGSRYMPRPAPQQHQRSRRHGSSYGRSSPRAAVGGGSGVAALRYRDGDEDQPVNNVRASAVGDGVPPTPTRDSRRQHHLSISPFTLLPIIIRSTAAPSKATSPEEEAKRLKQQQAMDEYIEYAERRYSRMHPRQPNGHHNQRRREIRRQREQQRGMQQGEEVARRSKVILDFKLPRKIFFSTVSLHRSPQSPSAPADSAASVARPTKRDLQDAWNDEDDPLAALGLSGLASPRLRQRLHVPRDLRDEASMLAEGATGAVNFISHCAYAAAAAKLQQANNNSAPAVRAGANKSRAAAAASAATNQATETSTHTDVEKVTAGGGRSVPYVALSFPDQARLLLFTLTRLLRAFVETAAILASFAGRVCGTFLEGGGFRRTARTAAAAAVAMVFMFRPLFRGAYNMRRG